MARASDETIDSLLVEDNPGDARLIEEAFRELGIPIDFHTVATASEALDHLERRVEYSDAGLPDLIFLDLGLPGSSGWDLLDDLADRSPSTLGSIPVIVITNSQAEEDMFDSLDNEQVHAYFTKPYDPAEYVELARSLADFLAQENGPRRSA